MFIYKGKPKPPHNPAVKGSLKYSGNLNIDPQATVVKHYTKRIP